jgi:arylsulfatase A-like enzyme
VITGTWDDKDSQKPGFPDNLGYDISDGPTGNVDGDAKGGLFIDNIKLEEFVDKTEKLATIEHKDPKLTFSINSRAISFMEQMSRENTPFYMQVSYYAIHLRMQALKETIAKYQHKSVPERKILPGIGPMLEDLDTAIGKLLDAIDELGIRDNTYVILFADNGGQETKGDLWHSGLPSRTTPYKEGESNLWKLPMHNANLGRNHPLHGAKGTLYEGGIRVPMIVLGPGIKGGSICRVPVAGYDFLPTFYDLAGGKKKIPQVLDGGSLKNILENNGKGKVQRPVDGLVFHQNNPEQNKFYSVYREGIMKLVITKNAEGEITNIELFNLSKDISESENLAEKKTRKANKLQEKLDAYLKEIE